MSDSLRAAKDELGLTKEETALYERHLKNLKGPGGVDNKDGSRSTLFALTTEIDGKTYVIPTVRDGKILPPEDAIKAAEKDGLEKLPSYATQEDAKARYDAMHEYMDQDTAQYLKMRKLKGESMTIVGSPAAPESPSIVGVP